MKELVAQRVPPGDRWALIDEESAKKGLDASSDTIGDAKSDGTVN